MAWDTVSVFIRLSKKFLSTEFFFFKAQVAMDSL